MSQKSERLLRIYSRLKQGPVTIEIIKEWASKNNINISERTFYRDLDDLELALLLTEEKLVVKIGEKNKKIWKIEFQSSRADLDDFDINSYFLFKNFLPLPVVLSRKKTLDKIENLFYSTNSKSPFERNLNISNQQISGSHFYEVSNIEKYQKTLTDAIWSIQNKREMEILEIDYDYTSISKSVCFPLRFLPLQILYHRGVVHIAGFIKDSSKLLILALEQMKNYEITNDMFNNTGLLNLLEKKKENRFGITENNGEEIYDIEIEFSELTGTFVQNQIWHKTQVFEKLENGNVIMKLKCGINRELVGWIFQWMSNAKVLQPQVLANTVEGKLIQTTQLYKEEQLVISNNSFCSD